MLASAPAARIQAAHTATRARARDLFPTAAVLILGGWLRLRELSWTRFTSDQANFLGAIRDLVRYGRWPLLGPDIGPGFWQWGHLGPAHFYLSAPAFWVSDGLPEAIVAFVALLHVAGLVCVIRAGRRFVSPAAGWIAGVLLAVAPYPVFVARELVNFSFVPPVVALLVLATLEAAVARRLVWLAVALPCVAFLVQVHASTWALAPLPLLALAGVRGRWRAFTIGCLGGVVLTLAVLGPYLWGQIPSGFHDLKLFLHAATSSPAVDAEVPFPNLAGVTFAFDALHALPHDPYVPMLGDSVTAIVARGLVAAGVLVATIAVLGALRRRRLDADAIRDVVLLSSFLVVPLALLRFRHELYHRHVIAAAPVAALLAARALVWADRRVPSLRPVLAAGLAVLGAALGWHTLAYQRAVVAESRIAGGIPLAAQRELAGVLGVGGALRWDSSERLRMPGEEDSRFGLRYLLEELVPRTVSERARATAPRAWFTVAERRDWATAGMLHPDLAWLAGGAYPVAVTRSPLPRDAVSIRTGGGAALRTSLPWSGSSDASTAEVTVHPAVAAAVRQRESVWLLTTNGCVDGVWLDQRRVHASHCGGSAASLPWPRAEGFVLPEGSGTLRVALRHGAPTLWIDLCELPFAPPENPAAPAAEFRWAGIPIHRPDSRDSDAAQSSATADSPRFLR